METGLDRQGESTLPINTIGLIIFVVGIALILAEAFTPGTFILVPGIALVIVGALLMALPELTTSLWAPVIFIVAFLPAFLLAFYFYKHLAPPGKPTTLSSDSLVGRTGLVKTDVSPGNIRGKVMIEQETWSATSEQVIPVGTKVVVTQVVGVKVVVRPVDQPTTSRWEETLEVEA
jgi:membrane protein implicated in regulation of membrane protease activity